MRDDAFSRLEDQLQRLVEGGLSRLLAGRLHPQDLANQLIRAMEDRALPGIGVRKTAPDRFRLRLPTGEFELFQHMQSDLTQWLAEELLRHARAHDLLLVTRPTVLLLDGGTELSHFQIETEHSRVKADTTDSMKPISMVTPALPAVSLMIDGRAVRVEKAVYQIGRHRSNDLILDDSSVSRFHAQLRFREGGFVVVDMDSRAGLTVNNIQVREAALRSGDLIGLGAVRLVYVEEPDTPTSAHQPLQPGSTP